jgi:hypothetical protein
VKAQAAHLRGKLYLGLVSGVVREQFLASDVCQSEVTCYWKVRNSASLLKSRSSAVITRMPSRPRAHSALTLGRPRSSNKLLRLSTSSWGPEQYIHCLAVFAKTLVRNSQPIDSRSEEEESIHTFPISFH